MTVQLNCDLETTCPALTAKIYCCKWKGSLLLQYYGTVYCNCAYFSRTQAGDYWRKLTLKASGWLENGPDMFALKQDLEQLKDEVKQML